MTIAMVAIPSFNAPGYNEPVIPDVEIIPEVSEDLKCVSYRIRCNSLRCPDDITDDWGEAELLLAQHEEWHAEGKPE